jgi:hypothetical protein
MASMVRMQFEESIAPVASRQHALITLEQVNGLGFGRHHIDVRIAQGRLRRVRPAVFAIAGAPATWEQAALSAVLAAGPDAVASHMTAAVLWGLPNCWHENVFEVSTPRPRRARHRGVHVHRTVRFLEIEHTVRSHIPVTSVARTLVDMSGSMSVEQLGIATDYARRENLLCLPDLRKCVAGLRPAPGRRPKRIHAVLGARISDYDKSESGLEMRILRAIVGADLPEPVQQHWVRLNGRWRRIDLAYPELKLAIEVDGWRDHGPRSAFDSDRARENELEIADWDRLHFTSAFSDRAIAETVARKLATLGQKLGREARKRPNAA